MPKIVLTGGGTAGHVTPNLAIIPELRKRDYSIRYIGSYEGIEKELVAAQEDVSYSGISTGKFRRYFSLKNISDIFRVFKGYGEAKKLIKYFNPDVVFSKGGYVAVPVVWAAAKYKVPVVIHESDVSVGLANKLCKGKAVKACHNFPDTAKTFGSKAVYTGSPIREELFTGSKEAGLKMCGFTTDKPVILVMGGSLGSEFINKSIRDSLDILLDKYQIVHLCGRGKLDKSLNNKAGYAQFEYIKDEMKDLYAMCDLVISRAGANAICEVKALKKPSILIPLSGRASRGDQILNAGSFKKQGFSEVLYEQYLDRETLALNIDKIFDNKEQYVAALENAEGQDSINQIVNLLDECCKKPKKKKK